MNNIAVIRENLLLLCIDDRFALNLVLRACQARFPQWIFEVAPAFGEGFKLRAIQTPATLMKYGKEVESFAQGVYAGLSLRE